MGSKIMVLSSVPYMLITEYHQFRGTGCLHLPGCKHGVNVEGYTDNLQGRPIKGNTNWSGPVRKVHQKCKLPNTGGTKRVLSVSVYCDSNSHI
jgi:hypothetical protein